MGGQFNAIWAAPTVTGIVALDALRRLPIQLLVESGYVVVPMGGRIAGAREVVVGGLWVAGSVAVGWAL